MIEGLKAAAARTVILIPVPREHVYALRFATTFQVGEANYFIDEGFQTDGASIPRFAWITTGTPFAPEHIRAAVIHDYLYQTGKTDRKTADQVFQAFLLTDGVSGYQAWKMFWALRLFGWIAWRRYRRRGGGE